MRLGLFAASAVALLAGALVAPFAAAAPGTDPDPAGLTLEQKREAIQDLARVLRERYVLADVAGKAAAFLEEKLASGGYDEAADREAFADILTVDLQDVTGDAHLRFGAAPPPPPADAPAPTAEELEARRAVRVEQIRRGNYGLLRAEILPGNVGYLDVRRFQPPEMAGDTVVAAMGFLSGADALIVDLRHCHGGSAFIMPLFAGYFFPGSTHLFDMEFRGDGVTDHYWTWAWLPGKRLAEIPMYILTSAYTFSGAEGFAYRLQVLKRATIVGETTAGGAHAGGVREIAPFFRVYMPMGRPVDSQTGTNWEGTGVMPDIPAPSLEALEVAHVAALKALREKAGDDGERARLDWCLERAEARRRQVVLQETDRARLAGTYGTARVWEEGGQLRYQREGTPVFLLSPLSGSVFAAEADESLRFEFASDAGGRVRSLIITTPSGDRWEYERTG